MNMITFPELTWQAMATAQENVGILQQNMIGDFVESQNNGNMVETRF